VRAYGLLSSSSIERIVISDVFSPVVEVSHLNVIVVVSVGINVLPCIPGPIVGGCSNVLRPNHEVVHFNETAEIIVANGSQRHQVWIWIVRWRRSGVECSSVFGQ